MFKKDQLNQKQYQQPYQKHDPEDYHFHPEKSEQYYSYVSKKNLPIPVEQVLDLFWKFLVNLGWRWNDTNKDDIQLVLACPECDKAVDYIPYKNMTEDNLKHIRQLDYVKRKFKGHREFCKGEYKE